MFGAQGQASSRDYAFPLTTICGAPIRVSFFVVFFFGLQIVQIAQSYANAPFKDLGFQVLYATGNEFILLFTVLCHEFGHGNMARYLGGSIDHILLWVFGGICFSTRPAGVYDNVKLLKNDLLIVGAGPATHFLQAPAWGLLLWPVAILVNAVSSYSDPLATVGYDNLWQVFLACLNPFDAGTLAALAVRESAGMWVALLWILVCSGISLNVSLFLFNVFFSHVSSRWSETIGDRLHVLLWHVPSESGLSTHLHHSTLCLTHDRLFYLELHQWDQSWRWHQQHDGLYDGLHGGHGLV
mmetsp:Transcript_49336/g.106195  ORF Transcript_49336/g.106195 Transcript_49336/m.106195 type:complete len:297 (-) Transcript_49336:766-1656(-)